MATSRLIALHCGKGRSVGTAISDIIEYVKNPEKTDNGQLITSYQCDSRIADAEFLFQKKVYQQKTGRMRGQDDVIAYHLRQSFAPGEITPQEANRLGCELAKRFTKGRHSFIVCTHIDKHHVHNHIIYSAVTLDHSRKFRDFKRSGQALRRLNDTICIENGYSIVENPKQHGKSYNKWLGDTAGLSHREIICRAIDAVLTQKPASFEDLLKGLEQMGYQVKRGKVPSLLGGTQKRFIRMDTLGKGYSPAELEAVIAGERSHTPRPVKMKPAKQTQPRNQLLIDIEEKLAQGKGPGFAIWAKKHNLKQMAQTVSYLQEHGLMNYAALAEKTAAASALFHETSDTIKAAEQRLAEITIMQNHISNYAKTRDIYVAYRKAGYSKKFLDAHEGEIMLHKQAKQFFDSQGLKKLPSIKSLKAEYAKLLEKKKDAYSEYQKQRKEMRELLIAKANVDRILGVGERGDRTTQKEQQTDAR